MGFILSIIILLRNLVADLSTMIGEGVKTNGFGFFKKFRVLVIAFVIDKVTKSYDHGKDYSIAPTHY